MAKQVHNFSLNGEVDSRWGFNQVFESCSDLRILRTDRAQLSVIFHKKGGSSSDRKESGNAEGRESTGRVAVFRVSSRDDGPVALAEAGSVIWVGPSYARDDQPFDLDVLFRSPRSPPCPPVSLSRTLVLVLSAFNPRDSLENLSGMLPIPRKNTSAKGRTGPPPSPMHLAKLIRIGI